MRIRHENKGLHTAPRGVLYDSATVQRDERFLAAAEGDAIMLKKLFVALPLLFLASQAQAATFLILPAPGTFGAATIIYNPDDPDRDRVFVCASASHAMAGDCRLVRNARP
jgi:hypothetical protein